MEGSFMPVMKERWEEIKRCQKSGAYLSTVILTGSILEGILLGIAQQNPREFNTAQSAPKDSKSEKVKPFPQWSLSQLIDVSYETEWIDLDVKKHAHCLRDFRNYIHPFQQKLSNFNPTEETTKIALQVFKAALCQIQIKNNKR